MPTVEELLAELELGIEPLDLTDPYFKGVIYGPKGTGKTIEGLRLAKMLCPVGKEIILIDAVEGWVSTLNHPEESLTHNVRRMVYKNVTQLKTLVSAIAAKAGSFDHVGVIVIDEFSTMSKKDLDAVLAARSKKDPTKDPDVATQPDFYSNTERMRRLILGEGGIPGLLALPLHVIILAHQRVDKNQRTGVEVEAAAFMPKFAEALSENVHVVAQMRATERATEEGAQYVRTIQVHPTRTVDAKTRIRFDNVLNTLDTFNRSVVDWVTQGGTIVAEKEVSDDIDTEIRIAEDDLGIEVED